MHEVITNNLDLWTSALLTKSTAGRGSNGKQEAYGIKKLRELILELAVRGKLVPQDPNDEPASCVAKTNCSARRRSLLPKGRSERKSRWRRLQMRKSDYELPEGWECR